VYAAVFAAAALGLVMFAMIVGCETYVMRNRPQEERG